MQEYKTFLRKKQALYAPNARRRCSSETARKRSSFLWLFQLSKLRLCILVPPNTRKDMSKVRLVHGKKKVLKRKNNVRLILNAAIHKRSKNIEKTVAAGLR